jgi:Right handed beta helix region
MGMTISRRLIAVAAVLAVVVAAVVARTLTRNRPNGGQGAATGTSTASLPPSPAATPTGAGSPRPGGWPGPANTGWQPTGVTLQPLACNNGDVLQIDQPGTVIDGKDIACGVYVTASGVTVRRSRITTAADWAVRVDDKARGLRIEDTEIAGQPGCLAAVAFANWTGDRLDIHGCGDGVRAEGDVLLADSWVHGFWDGYRNGRQVDTPHHDGLQTTGGSDITVRHNRIDNPHSQTSCLMVGGEYGSPSNILIEDNYLNGGNFTIYLDPKGTNRVIRGNTFTKAYVYGPAAVGGQYTWQHNRYADGSPLQE